MLLLCWRRCARRPAPLERRYRSWRPVTGAATVQHAPPVRRTPDASNCPPMDQWPRASRRPPAPSHRRGHAHFGQALWAGQSLHHAQPACRTTRAAPCVDTRHPGSNGLAALAVALVGRRIGLGRAGRVAQVVAPSSAPMARSIKAFLKAMEAALTASPVIGPVTNWSSSSLGIFGSAAPLAAMAAFFNFVLLGRNGPVGHGHTSNTKLRTGSSARLPAI